ncbi:MAG: hypothetical protein DRJ65_10785 [Acidobacteria bacterium]|nr:MAG: hypothetical protein DRJ65_10785 [Acidobacteriota bacterium]
MRGCAFFIGQPSQQDRRYEECTTGQRSASASAIESPAYGVVRDSIADVGAEGSQVRHSSQRHRFLEDCPVKKA